MKTKEKDRFHFAKSLLLAFATFVSLMGTGSLSAAATPQIFYTDIISGPNTGGENNKGIYLSIFGVNFGTVAANIKVTVGGGAADHIVYFGPSNGRPDIQQISVQLGSLVKTGAVQVFVTGVASNADHTFTVSPGKIYFVDNNTVLSHGLTSLPNDNNPGTINAPFRHVQTANGPDASTHARPGDFIVMRGYAGPYNEAKGCSTDKPCLWGVAYNDTATGTSATTAITLMGYPGEFPYANVAANSAQHGGIFVWNGVPANYINIVGIHMEAAGNQGAIDVDTSGAHWRVVNNNVSMSSANSTSHTWEGAITGDSAGQYWVGNHIHDVNGDSQNQTHGIYIDGKGSYEVAYNWIENINHGTGIQLYGDNGPNGNPTVITDTHIHHNIVHNTLKYGILIANNGGSGTMTNIVAWDNLIYNTGLPGLIFNYIDSSAPLQGCLIYNNTFYNVCTSSSCTGGIYGAIDNDNGSVLTSSSVKMFNNIVVPHTGVAYYSENASGLTSIKATQNLWYGGHGNILGTTTVSGNPNFVAPPPATQASGGTLPNMHLNAGSPAINTGTNNVLTGNGIASKDQLPAFVGVTDDLIGVKRVSGSVDIGVTEQ